VALACDDDFAVLSSLKHAFEGIEMDSSARPLAAVATEAGAFKQRANVFHERDVLRLSRRRELGRIKGRYFRSPIDLPGSTTAPWLTRTSEPTGTCRFGVLALSIARAISGVGAAGAI
jgi:hypothetical protein